MCRLFFLKKQMLKIRISREQRSNENSKALVAQSYISYMYVLCVQLRPVQQLQKQLDALDTIKKRTVHKSEFLQHHKHKCY